MTSRCFTSLSTPCVIHPIDRRTISGAATLRALCPRYSVPMSISVHYWFGRTFDQSTPSVARCVFWSLYTHPTLSHSVIPLGYSYSMSTTCCQVHVPFWHVLSIRVPRTVYSLPFLFLYVPLILVVVYMLPPCWAALTNLFLTQGSSVPRGSRYCTYEPPCWP